MRETWGSRTGFILAAVGSAVGLGNIWKFPNLIADNGGGAILIIYIGVVTIIGMSALVAELAFGRLAQSNIFNGYLVNSKTKFMGLFGILALLTAFFLLSFYFIVAGWSLNFAWQYFFGMFGKEVSTDFIALISGGQGAFKPFIWGLIFQLATMGIILMGVRSGIEAANKILMPALFLMVLYVIFRVFTITGVDANGDGNIGSAIDGLKYYLTPDWSKVSWQAIGQILGTGLFSLSIGFAVMMTYGSYLDRKENITSSAAIVAFSDTLVATLAGLMTIPVVFAFEQYGGSLQNPEISRGPGLVFVTLPVVFNQIGAIFGFIFFTLLTIAALTSNMSLAEPIVVTFMERFKMSRIGASIVTFAGALTLGFPISLSYGGYDILGWSKDFFHARLPWQENPVPLLDFFSDMTDYIMLPISALAVVIFIAWFVWDKFTEEMTSEGKYNFSGTKVMALRITMGIIVPAALLVIIYQNVISKLF